MATQTTYTENIRPAVAGQIVDTIPKTLISRTVEAAGGLPFGVPVARGAGDRTCRPFAAGDTAAKLLGVSVRERSLHAEGNAFKQYDSARILPAGAVWVVASVAVTAGQPVYVVPASGVWTNVATDNVLVAGAAWDTSTTTANQLAQIRLG